MEGVVVEVVFTMKDSGTQPCSVLEKFTLHHQRPSVQTGASAKTVPTDPHGAMPAMLEVLPGETRTAISGLAVVFTVSPAWNAV